MADISQITLPNGETYSIKDTSKAPLASPTFTGTPAAPTAATGTNTTQIATTAFVQNEISNAEEIEIGTTEPTSSYTKIWIEI